MDKMDAEVQVGGWKDWKTSVPISVHKCH